MEARQRAGGGQLGRPNWKRYAAGDCGLDKHKRHTLKLYVSHFFQGRAAVSNVERRTDRHDRLFFFLKRFPVPKSLRPVLLYKFISLGVCDESVGLESSYISAEAED